MKAILKNVFINLLVIYLVDLSCQGFAINHDLKTLLTAAIIWLLLNKIVKPIIKLLLLPINLITLNLFSWVISLILLVLLQMIVSDIEITAFLFPGYTSDLITLSPFEVSLLLSYIITSALLNLYHSLIMWLIRKDTSK